MRATLITVPVLALCASSLLVMGTADATAPRASTTVTIKAEGVELSGTVKSPKPKKCADERKVILVKQKGARGGGNDETMGSDTTEQQGDKYVWNTGTTGEEGRFYAKVKKTADCKADTSPTVKAERPEESRAAARAKRAAVKVSISASSPVPFSLQFDGRVSSKSAKKCAKERTVTVYMVGTDGDTSVGTGETAKEGGKWIYSVTTAGVPGDFYAKVKRNKSCKIGKSKTISASGLPNR